MIYTYIKRDIIYHYVERVEMIDPNIYGNVGSTWEDYMKYYWVPLSDEQVEFHKGHPDATVHEVWNMQLDPKYEDELIEFKEQRIKQVKDYDNSEVINSFTIDNTITTWFTPEQRSNYRNSIDSAKLLGIHTLSLLIGDQIVEINTEKAEYILANIQIYADNCYVVTQRHISSIMSLTDIEDIKNYDYTTGYPEKLNFSLQDAQEPPAGEE